MNLAVQVAQQFADAHVAGSPGSRATRVGAGTTDGDVLVFAELIETLVCIFCVLPVEVTLSFDEHRVLNIATRKAEGLLQIAGRKQS